MASPTPDWLPLVIVLFQGLMTLVMVLIGMVLKGMKGEIKDNSTRTGMVQQQVHQTETNLRKEIHDLALNNNKDFASQADFDKLREDVTKDSLTLAMLKTRDEVRWLDQGSKKQTQQSR